MIKGVARKAAKTALFLALLMVIFNYVSSILLPPCDNSSYQRALEDEPDDSLDAIYIGASPTFTSWVAPLAWGKYGIAARVYGNNSQPIEAIRHLVSYAHESQPDAVYLISINGIYEDGEMSVDLLHASTDYFVDGDIRQQGKRFGMISELSGAYRSSQAEKFELMFPITRYHTRWNSLTGGAFHKNPYPYKGGYVNETFFNVAVDISESDMRTSERAPLSDLTRDTMTRLLEFCVDEDIRAVFVLSAQFRDRERNLQYNAALDMAREYGFPVIDEMEDFEKIGLDPATDFYNEGHTNIHGALKITDYMARYLMENYDFIDKRGEPGYSDWDDAYKQYGDIVRPYLRQDELQWVQ